MKWRGIMKKVLILIFVVSILVVSVEGEYIGKIYFKSKDGQEKARFFVTKSINLKSFFAKEIKAGNLRLSKIQEDPIASMEHCRYSQFYQGLEVFGGQIIQHYRNGDLVGINGEYYEISDIDTVPGISKDEAVAFFNNDLNEVDLHERSEEPNLFIYPLKDDDYHLAYKVTLEKDVGYSMTGLIDAKTGEIIIKYSNINYEKLTIGHGIGYHGGQYKLPTTEYNGFFYLYDEKKIRPVNQYTHDSSIGGYIPSDNDNFWDFDGVLVNLHAFLGWTYDYYYQVHKRNGINDYNLDIIAIVHDSDSLDNAYWDGNKKMMYFGDPYYSSYHTAAALDVIAHEYSHGVTQFNSNLVYRYQSGALNESFSDIMGTAVEFYWQSEGKGFNKADWVVGEDMYPNYSSYNYMRSLSNPNSKNCVFGGAYPCHLSQEYYLPCTEWGDWGGVHVNMTIYSHAYYLLAHGGTNKVSKKKVSGIGIDKATQIFYRAWVYYLTQTSTFWHAASALGQSAWDLYGGSSNEYAQTIKAMKAIGWIYN